MMHVGAWRCMKTHELSQSWTRPIQIKVKRWFSRADSSIYINKNVNVRLWLWTQLRKFFTDCFQISIQRCIRIRACFYLYRTQPSVEEAVEPDTLSEFFTDCFALWTKRCIPLRKCVHIHLRGKRWSYKHRWFKHVHLRKFSTHRFEILTQRCIPIRASVHVKSICGWKAVEPQTLSETSSPIGFKFWHTVAFEYARVFIYGVGCNGTGRDVMGCDGMGRHMMGWDGTQPQQRVAGNS
jgi:hypothetical protein